MFLDDKKLKAKVFHRNTTKHNFYLKTAFLD